MRPQFNNLTLNNGRNHAFYGRQIAFLSKKYGDLFPKDPYSYDSSLVQVMTRHVYRATDDPGVNELTDLPIQSSGEVNSYHKQDMDI